MSRRFAKALARVFLAAVFVMALYSGNTVGAASPIAPQVQTDQAQSDAPYATLVAEAAHRFGIPAAWIDAVIHAESGGNPHAVSSSGAMGLMQLMPQTWRELRVALSLGDDPFDPNDNIMAGAAYLRAMRDRYGMPGALAAYNAGPGRWEAFRAGVQPLPDETIAYVTALAPMIDGQVPLPAFGHMLRPGSAVRNGSAEPIFVGVGTLGSTDTKQPDPHDNAHLTADNANLTADNANLVLRDQNLFVATSSQSGSAVDHTPTTLSGPFDAHPEDLFPLARRQPRAD